MRAHRTPILLAAAVLLAFASTASAAIVVTVDKSSQTMSVVVDGVPRWQWPVSTGRSGYATPSGSYTAFRMEEDHYSKEWDDAPMPHSIFFSQVGHAIHGSFETKNLGRAVSHGCVRLAPPNAAKLFALVKEQGVTNTKVVITGTQPNAAPAVARTRPMPQPGEPLQVAPGYGQAAAPGYAARSYGSYGQPVAPRYEEPVAPGYGQRVAPGYEQRVAPSYGQASPDYRQPDQPVFVQPRYWNEYR